MHSLRSKLGAVLATVVMVAGLTLATSATASASPSRTQHQHKSSLSGTTAVTTAPGIAGTLIKAGVLPLPLPGTSFRLGSSHGQLTAKYGFPITGGNPDLTGPSGDILHSGGIYFTNLRKSLAISNFDIDLAAGKVFATKVNFKAARIAVLDLDLSGLSVSQSHGVTTLSGIVVRLDPAAAGALNATFGLPLPTDGSLVFGSATVTLRT